MISIFTMQLVLIYDIIHIKYQVSFIFIYEKYKNMKSNNLHSIFIIYILIYMLKFINISDY